MKASSCLKTEKITLPRTRALKYPKKTSPPSSPTSSSSLKLIKSFKNPSTLIKPTEVLNKNLEKTKTLETQASQTNSNLQLRLKLRPYKDVDTGRKHLKQPHSIKPWNSRDHNRIKENFFLNLEEDALLRPYTSEVLIKKHQPKEFSFANKMLYWREKKLSQYKFFKRNSLSPNSKPSFSINDSKYSTRPSVSPNSLLDTSEFQVRFSLKDYFISPILNKV